MKIYKIPNTDLEVSSLCFGTSSLGTQIKGDLADSLIAEFIKFGGNFFDTAHCYSFWEENGFGASERELGACLKRLGHWNNAVIATKGGHPDGGEKYRRPDYYISEATVASDIDESLERLGTDCIDLYFLHRDDTRLTVAEIISILNNEIKQGRIRYIGASNLSVNRIAEANEYASKNGLQGFVISEVQWSLAVPNWKIETDPTMRHVTKEDAEWYVKAQMPIMAYSSTAGGYFSGNNISLFDNPTSKERQKRANELAKKLGYTPTQIALAYLMNQPSLVIPIFRTADNKHLKEILDSVSISLDDEQIQWLRDV